MPPINEKLILEITHMVTEETLGKDTNSGWRGGHVQVISVRQKVIYPASFGSFPKQIKYRWNRFILFTFPEHSIYTGCLYASSHNAANRSPPRSGWKPVCRISQVVKDQSLFSIVVG